MKSPVLRTVAEVIVVAAAVVAVVVLASVVGQARGKLADERVALEDAQASLGDAENQVADLRREVVRLSAALDQERALAGGAVAPSSLRALEDELQESERRARELESRMARESAAEAGPDFTRPPEPGEGVDEEMTEEERAERERRRAEWEERRSAQRREFQERAQGVLSERIASYQERIDTSATKEEAAVAGEIAARLEGMQGHILALGESDDPGARREQFMAMGQLWRDLGGLMEKDRAVRLQSLAAQIGYDDPNASQQFVDYIDQIYRETSFDPRSMMGGDRGGRGGPGGGGRGR